MTRDVETASTKAPESPAAKPGSAGSEPPQSRRLAGIMSVIVALVVLVIAGVVVFGIRDRKAAAEGLIQTANANKAERVSVVYPRIGVGTDEMVLPANMQAFVEAPIYARTHGYLKSWYFDIGAHVHQGDLLAEVDTPEVDQQLEQARADLKSAQADMDLAHTTSTRWQSLLAKRAVSTQETDQAVSNFASKQAVADANAANVRRLEQLQSYEKVYAPFEGVITARETDVGALIDGDSSPRELFHLAMIDRLRVYVPVPEVSAAAFRTGKNVTLTSDQYPNEVFDGTLVRNSSAIDPASRTLNVEVDIRNPNGKLLPGSYAFVHIPVSSGARGLQIPSSTLIFRAQGLQVGVVRSGHAQLVAITIGHDYGASVEVASGLKSGDSVILSPSDSLIDGTPVEVEKGDRQ